MTLAPFASLESKIQHYGSATQMLRRALVGDYGHYFPPGHRKTLAEPTASHRTVVSFAQTFHMKDEVIEGPDVVRLLSDVIVNPMTDLLTNKAKQIVACNHEGHVIGDAVLVGHAENKVSVVGRPSLLNWLAYNAIKCGYDVKVTRSEPTFVNQNRQLSYRYQIQGPNALDLIKYIHEGPFPDISPFNFGELKIAGCRVRALNHSMSCIGGLELHGPANDGEIVRDAILNVGAKFGLVQGDGHSFFMASIEGNWIPSLMPAIYHNEKMKPYRQWLPATEFEANAYLSGSFNSSQIADYYQTPWELGYGSLVKFDHDFIGRAALEKLATKPHRRRVWLRWSKADSHRVLASQFGEGERYKYVETTSTNTSILPFDKVIVDGKLAGWSSYTIYNAYYYGWHSLAVVDGRIPNDSVVALIWGEARNSPLRQMMGNHVQTPIQCKVSYI